MLIATTIGAEGQPKVLIGISRRIIDHLLGGNPATMKTKSVEVTLMFAETPVSVGVVRLAPCRSGWGHWSGVGF